MSRSLPCAAVILVSPLLLALSGCDTIYSNTYSYQKTKFMVVKDTAGNNVLKSSYVFQPYEQQALERAEIDKQRGEAERMSKMARDSAKVNVDRMASEAPGLKNDSGLGGLPPMGAGGMSGSSSIPGLESSMSSGTSIPGLEPSMTGTNMSGASSMTGSSMSGSAAPASAPMQGAGSMQSDSMQGGMMQGGMMQGSTMEGSMAPAPAAAPKPPATTMLPGL